MPRWVNSLTVSSAILLIALTSCASESVERGPYYAEFEQALREATTDFQRQILADHVVTDAELNEARQRRADCLEGWGFYTVDDTNMAFSSNTYVAPGDEQIERDRFDEAYGECEKGTTFWVSQLYYQVRDNPEKRDYQEWIAECFVNNGVRSNSYNKAELLAEQEAGALHANAEIDAWYQTCSEDPDHVGPVEIDPDWVKPEITEITVHPDGTFTETVR